MAVCREGPGYGSDRKMFELNRLASIVACGVVALVLAGCATRTPATVAASSAPSAAASTSVASDPTSPAGATASPGATVAAAQPAALEASPAPADSRAVDGKDMVGLSPDELQRLLGQPQMVRDETGAEVWQYHAQACVLDLYLYPQEAKGLRVAYLEARDRSAASFATARCVTALMTERRELPTS